ncbi:glycosyltransferase family 4 protein [Formosa haliotis]|uniref:glycosyltransferase family 4 protein n=1 Tax=Formosa haliotis TaxID=1555194 RepID=UPI000826A37C|nr:glycosyltransferase family 4 protein [Formosa haliotis]
MKKNVLYLGNNLSSTKTNVSYMKGLSVALEREGFNVLCKSAYLNKGRRILDMVLSTFKYGPKRDYALIDTYSTQNFYYALVVSQVCRFIRLPYIPILHGGNLPQRLTRNPKLCKLLFQPAKALVSPSRYLESVFKTHGYTNVVYIPNSLQIENYLFQSKPIAVIKLLWVRSFSTIYNPKLAIDILKKLLDTGHKAELCMVGPDTDGSISEVKAYADTLGLFVTFTGKLTKQKWTTLAQDYNVFINTTNFDNMPVSVIEAMALGLPVISTNVGGMPFLIDHEQDGLLVPPNDADAFVEAINRLKDQPELVVKLTKQARAKVETYDWEVVKAKWISVLE